MKAKETVRVEVAIYRDDGRIRGYATYEAPVGIAVGDTGLVELGGWYPVTYQARVTALDSAYTGECKAFRVLAPIMEAT